MEPTKENLAELALMLADIEVTKEVVTKLSIIQSKIAVKKDLHNSFGNYNYRSAEGILEALKPILKEVKAAIVLTDNIIMVGDRYYVKARASLYDCEKSGVVSSTASAREQEVKKGMDQSQITGSASSYARKYALSGLLALDDGKDADSDDNREKEKEPEDTENNIETKKIELKERLRRLGLKTEKEVLTYLHTKHGLDFQNLKGLNEKQINLILYRTSNDLTK